MISTLDRLRARLLTAAGSDVNVAVTAAATTLAITFARAEASTAYGVVVTPHWNTTVWVTNKATTGCTLNFGTGPGANSSLDWLTFHDAEA